ncbi:MAG: sensor domain-containing diguanylate cyclase [Chloroflexota bacterium]
MSENSGASGPAQDRLVEALHAIARALDHSREMEAVLEGILSGVGLVVPFDAACVYLAGPLSENFSCAYVQGYPEPARARVLGTRLALQEHPLLRKMAATHIPVILSDGGDGSIFGELPGTEWVRSFACAAVSSQGRLAGVILLESAAPASFTRQHAVYLGLLAEQAALVIEGVHLYGQVQHEIKQRRVIQDSLSEANKLLMGYIDAIEELQAELREQTIRDPLTGVFNRRYLEETLERESARSARSNQPVSVIIMDADHFKRVNDVYGHKAGDLVLKGLGDLLKTRIRSGDIACRFGGEEFLIVMPGASVEVAADRAEQVRSVFETLRFVHENREIRATLSLGVAGIPEHASDGEDVLICADRALQQAKQLGRNRVVVYDPGYGEPGSDAPGAPGEQP